MAQALQLVERYPQQTALNRETLGRVTTSYERLSAARYEFASGLLLSDAETVLAFSPGSPLAQEARLRAQTQIKQQQQMYELAESVYSLETDFVDDLTHLPSHRQVVETAIRLPSFMAQVDKRYYLGAVYGAIGDKPLTDYQLTRLLRHQDQVLAKAAELSRLLAKMASDERPADYEVTREAALDVVGVHQRLRNHMLKSLLADGLTAAEQSFKQISEVAATQMRRGQFEKVWDEQISPISHKQWLAFEAGYLKPLKQIKSAVKRQQSEDEGLAQLLAQSFPHAKLTHKYFWPEKDKDLKGYVAQGPVRAKEAAAIRAELAKVAVIQGGKINASYDWLASM